LSSDGNDPVSPGPFKHERRGLFHPPLAIPGGLGADSRLDSSRDATLELLGGMPGTSPRRSAAGDVATVAQRGLRGVALGVRRQIGAGLAGWVDAPGGRPTGLVRFDIGDTAPPDAPVTVQRDVGGGRVFAIRLPAIPDFDC
jgi:hypothetical protein